MLPACVHGLRKALKRVEAGCSNSGCRAERLHAASCLEAKNAIVLACFGHKDKVHSPVPAGERCSPTRDSHLAAAHFERGVEGGSQEEAAAGVEGGAGDGACVRAVVLQQRIAPEVPHLIG